MCMKSIAVVSGKGGVGKSTIAAELAMALSRMGLRVALLDMDLYGPSLPTLFGIEDARHNVTKENKIVPIITQGIQLVSFGFILGELPAIMRGPMIARYTSQLLSDVAWESPDILLLDFPPGTGDIHLTATQHIALDAAVVISTPHALSFADVGKAIIMLNKVQVPVIGMIMNMAYYECPACRHTEHLFGDALPQVVAERFGLDVLGAVPLNPRRYSGQVNIDIPDQIVDTIAEGILPALEAYHRRPRITITNTHEAIIVDYGDGSCTTIKPSALRRLCRCALCYDEYHHRPRWTDPPADSVFAEDIKPIGNYALYVKWSDGHATGFFSLAQIRADGTTRSTDSSAKESMETPHGTGNTIHAST